MKPAIRLLLSLLVAALLLFVLARWGGVSAADVRAALGRLPLASYLAALGLHVLLYLLRTLRFQVLTEAGERPGFLAQLGITLSYGMASIVLPAKVGELSYVVYSGRALGTRGETALAVLLVARMLDMASLALGMGIACLVAPGPAWMVAAGAGALLVATAGFVVVWKGEWVVRVGLWMGRVLKLARWGVGARAIEKAEGLGGALQEAARGGTLLQAVALSLAAWACVFLFCAVLARGLGIGELGFDEVVFGSGLAMLTSLVPLSAFASFGTLEAGWVLGFGFFGVGRELALATGTGLHLVQLANVVALGLVGHVLMGVCGRRQRG